MSRLSPILLLLLAFTVLWPSSARADATADSGETVEPPSAAHGGRHSGKRLNPAEKSAQPGTIHGTCTIAENAANPLPGPCVNLLLILNDDQGNEVERTRTTEKGIFEFDAKKGQAYRIASGSRFYDISSPAKGSVNGGDRVGLVLQQKP